MRHPISVPERVRVYHTGGIHDRSGTAGRLRSPCLVRRALGRGAPAAKDPCTRLPGLRHRGGGRLSLIHISEPTRLGMISYAVFCLKKKKKNKKKKKKKTNKKK